MRSALTIDVFFVKLRGSTSAISGGGLRNDFLKMSSDPAHVEFERVLRPLWDKAQKGDQLAYRDALLAIAPKLRSYLRKRLHRSPDEIEDLVQETLLAIHTRRGTYDPAFPVTAWVYAIARHKAVDYWRRSSRSTSLHDSSDEVDEGAVAVFGHDETAAVDVESLLSELPEAQRKAIVLTKIQGLSVAEASQATGASESAIKVQVHRGLKRLASLIKR